MSWTNLLHWSAQVLLLVGVAGLTLHLARVRDARLRLWTLHLTLLGCLLLPLLEPTQPLIVVKFDGVLTPGVTPQSSAVKEISIFGIWATGVAIALLRLSMALVRVRALRRNSRPFAVREGVDVRIGADVASPVTFGFLNPVILLPRHAVDVAAAVREPMIAHELVHIRRRDWLFVMAEELIRAAVWFHPAIWWLLSQIRKAREQVIDFEVANDTGSDAYAESLLTAAQWRAASNENQPFPSIAMHCGGSLERRLQCILNPKETTMTRLHRASAIAALVFSTVGMVAVSTTAFPLFAQEEVKPKVLKKQEPAYPKGAKDAKIEGTVRITVVIGTDGRAGSFKVVSGDPQLGEAAIESVRGWEFEPGRKNGVPVDCKATIEVNFRLK